MTDPKMFQMLPFGYISNVMCGALLRVTEITLLERMRNSQKFGSLLTPTSWMVILHLKKEQKQQLTNEIKQFPDVLFCTYISNMEKKFFLSK